MFKINVNSVQFKIYAFFIMSSLIVFSIGIFSTIHNITFFNRQYLRARLRSRMMKTTMQFIGDREYMLEKANDIVAHNFKNSFMQGLFVPDKTSSQVSSAVSLLKNKKISNITLIRIKNGQISYIKKYSRIYYNGEKLSNYKKFAGIISARGRYIFAGFGKDKANRLIELKVIYWLTHKQTGYIIILNRLINSNYLKNIRLKSHMNAHLGVYYGAERSAISLYKNSRYLGLGQSATKEQLSVLREGKKIYTSVIVRGHLFYIYNEPIRNFEGKIIGILGSGVQEYSWAWYISKLYLPVFFFAGIFIFMILIFILINKKYSGSFSDLLKSIEEIQPNNPKKLNLVDKYRKGESEFYKLAETITDLNDTIIEKQEENSLIVSNINYFSKMISTQDDLNSLTDKLISLIVERMGYSYAWFGILEENSKDIKITNTYGDDFSYMKNLIFKYDDSKYSQNLAGRAIKSNNYEVINDIESDETIPLYKDKLLEYKFLSIGAFPLIVPRNTSLIKQDIEGVLMVYSNKKDAFDSIKAAAIFNLTNYVSYLIVYLKNLKKSLILSAMAEQILFSIVTGYARNTISADITGRNNTKINEQEFLNNLEDNLQTDFIEFIAYDGIKHEIVGGTFSKGWSYYVGKSSIEPTPTPFIQNKIAQNRLELCNYQKDKSATEYFINIGVEDMILYAFEGTENRRYLAVTGVVKRKKTFRHEDMEFFRDGANLFATHFEINLLFEKLDSYSKLVENRENLINKMIEFGVVSVNLTEKVVSLYNDYFAQVFGINKFSAPISIDEFYNSVKSSFNDESFAHDIFDIYIKDRYVTTIESVEINLKNGVVLSMKSSTFLTKNNNVIRLLVFGNITDSKNYVENIENLNKKLNLINEISYKLSMVFTLEYAIKTFAQGICSIKNEKSEEVDSLRINIFDTADKKTVTSLVYSKNKGHVDKTGGTKLQDKATATTNFIDYNDYLSNCKLLKNNETDRKNDGITDQCEFRGTDGSYTCFLLKISNEVVGTVSIESKGMDFFTDEINGLIKEVVNIASPVFAKLILMETSKKLAVTDPLTGIYNRRYMLEFTKREIIRAYRNKSDLSMAILDIDKFKDINDKYGHQIGDDMLVKFVNDLKNILIRKQDIITRHGGDEFVVVLPDTNKRSAIALMEKLSDYFKGKTYIINKNISINITISVGVSFAKYPSGSQKKGGNDIIEDSLNYLLKTADENLYKAKELGRNRIVG